MTEILKMDTSAQTLHNAKNRKEAQKVVETMTLEKQKDLILSVDENQQTALHLASESGRSDLVEYFCSLYKHEELLFKKDNSGCTALHYAKDKKTAKLLVQSVSPEKQKEFLLFDDEDELTALHAAASDGRTDVVEYLCSLYPDDDELLMMLDVSDKTALHYAGNGNIAKILVESVKPENQMEFLLAKDICQCTALHVAVIEDKHDVVEYLCSLKILGDALILDSDFFGNTALHHAGSRLMAEKLVESVTPESKNIVIQSTDAESRTALHVAASCGKTDVVEYLCSLCSDEDELILMRDDCGKTALHDAENRNIVEILVNSVTPAKQKDFVLAVDETKGTALHCAVAEERNDVAEFLCRLSINNELALLQDGNGRTALHFAQSKDMARVLVESFKGKRKFDFLKTTDNFQWSVLHSAAVLGNTDVVEYICKSFSDDELILQRDGKGRTALHYAKNREIAKLLVESVTLERQKELVVQVDENLCTALHKAAESGKTGIVDYFCSLSLTDDELLFKTDSGSMTLLHYAKNREIAELFVMAVKSQRQKEFVLSVDEDLWSVLHKAAFAGATEIVEYLCGLYANFDELTLKKDKHKNTALHYAQNREIAELLIMSTTAEKRRDLILSVDENQFTVLHNAAIRGRTDIVEYLCGIPRISNLLVLIKADNGYTALHYAKNGTIAKAIISLPEMDLMQVLSIKTNEGDTPILTLTSFGRCDAIKEILQHMEDEVDFGVMLNHIMTRNAKNQNILHLAALSPTVEELSNILQNYLCSTDIINMMYRDSYGNTPIHYIAAKYDTKTFADFMLHLPLFLRQGVADSSNSQLINCRKIIYRKSFHELFYIHKVLCDNTNKTLTSKFGQVKGLFADDLEQQITDSEKAFKYDGNILKVLKYSLNEYSLLDSTYKTSHTLFSSYVEHNSLAMHSHSKKQPTTMVSL